jgi:hypothetical protein
VRRLLNAGAGQGELQFGAVATPQVIRDASAKYGAQCIVVAIDAKRRRGDDLAAAVQAGTSTPTAGARTPAWTPFNGRAAWPSTARARFSSPAWTATAPRAGFDLALTRARERRGRPCRCSSSGGGGTLDHLPTASSKAAADAVLAASIFHYGEHTVGEAKALMASRGIPVAAVTARREAPRAEGASSAGSGSAASCRWPTPGLRRRPTGARDAVQLAGPGPRGWRCLDAFAGSGALGFEAASRGAAGCAGEREPAGRGLRARP